MWSVSRFFCLDFQITNQASPALLREVQMDWRQTIYEDCNPLDIALPLLDNTSVGLAHRHDEFLKLKDRISSGLKSAVTEHFQSFNQSIGSYRSIVQDIAASQTVANDIKKNVSNTSDFLKSDDHTTISTLNENLKNYNQMLKILNAIDELKGLSSEVENEINSKNYSKAQSLLQYVSKTAESLQLWQLPALSNLHDFFQTQEDQLYDILVEELHNILYSKNIFDSFQTPATNLLENLEDFSSIERYLINSIDVDIAESAKISQLKVDEFLQYLLKQGTDDENFLEFNSLDDSNPFNQILQILSLIHQQGKLQLTIKNIIQRLEPELNQLINRVVENAKLRHPKLIKTLNSKNVSATSLQDHILQKFANDNYSAVIIQDLFWNFFKKLLFFKQCIKVLVVINQKFESKNPDVLHFILNSDNDPTKSHLFLKGENNIDLNLLWEIAQVEIKNLILTYVAFDDSTSRISQYNSTSQKPSSLYQLNRVDYQKNKSIDIKSVLQDLFPGFIDSNILHQDDSPYIEDNKFLKQSRIIPSSIFHMRYILEPFLLYIQGLTLLVPDFEDEPLKFFNEFMINEFLPLLEEGFLLLYTTEIDTTTLELFEPTNLDVSHYETNELELALSEVDKSNKIFKSFAEFKILLNNICFILNASLQFRKEFSSIIFKVLNKFEDQLEELYQDLYNELLNHLESDRDIKGIFQNPTKKLTPALLLKTNINKAELKNSKIYFNFTILKNSMDFILEFFTNHLIKTIDLNKTDINLTKIEKLRKNWSFFEIMNIRNDSYDDETTALSFENVNKIILDDELKSKYEDIIKGFQKINESINHVTTNLNQIVE